MQNNICVNCGNLATEKHHIVPLALGGNDIESNKVWLCSKCHAIIHGLNIQRRGTYWKNLQANGIKQAKEKGISFGRPKIQKPINWNEIILKHLNKEITAKEAMKLVNVTKSTFYKYYNEWTKEVLNNAK